MNWLTWKKVAWINVIAVVTLLVSNLTMATKATKLQQQVDRLNDDREIWREAYHKCIEENLGFKCL